MSQEAHPGASNTVSPLTARSCAIWTASFIALVSLVTSVITGTFGACRVRASAIIGASVHNKIATFIRPAWASTSSSKSCPLANPPAIQITEGYEERDLWAACAFVAFESSI